MNAADLVLVTCDYKVRALRKSDGELIWETELISKWFKATAPFVTLAVDETGVYAHTYDQLFRLDLQTGAIVWKQELAPGKWLGGYGIASILLPGASSTSPAPQAAKIAVDRRRNNDGGGA